MKTFRVMALCAAASILPILLSPGRCSAQYKRAVNLAASPQALPFSDGIVVGNTLYIAGQQGTGSDGKLMPGGIAPQTKAALETIEKVVKAAGFRMGDVIAVNVYLADIHDFGAMNKVYTTFFPDPKPTRTTVQVAALVNGAQIEISAIAVRSPHPRNVAGGPPAQMKGDGSVSQ
jgi:2-iminobutanoate/2-iminopropanoate deaminase